MSTLITEGELNRLVREQKVIANGSSSCVEGVKYDFRLGKRILLPGGRPIDVAQLTESERGRLVLGPGSLMYVLTEERLELPPDVKAELSLKRKLSHAGVLILGGFCVDPGYQGRLLFGLYNFSTEAFPIEPGKKLIAAQFYRLLPEEVPPERHQVAVDDFPEDLMRFMANYAPATLQGIASELISMKATVDALRQEFHSKEEWFDRFQRFLEKHDRQIESITDGLKRENENRQQAEQEFRTRLTDISKTAVRSSVIIGLLYAIVIGVIVAVIAGLLMK